MSTATPISVEEYLATSYRPDCDFVDGQLIERNLGTKDHSKLQREVLVVSRSAAGVAAYRLPGTASTGGPAALPNPRRVRVPAAGTRRADIYTTPLHLYRGSFSERLFPEAPGSARRLSRHGRSEHLGARPAIAAGLVYRA